MFISGSLTRRLALSRRRMAQWRPTGPRLAGLLRSMPTSYLALGVTLYALPGSRSPSPLAVLALVVTITVVGALVRPLLAGLTALFGSLGLLLVGVLSQAVVLDLAIAVVPGVDLSAGRVLVVSWVAAAVAAVLTWVLDAESDDAFLAQLLGEAVRVAHRQGPEARRGLLVVQLDGVGEALLRQAITAGEVPALEAWLRSGTHVLRGWHTGLPSTTPAAQAVLLHGDVTEVPCYRWFEKDTGRMVGASRPEQAQEVEARISDGHGLLAGGGVSVSTLFSGDASVRLLTMSDAGLPPRRNGALAALATERGGLVRTLAVVVREVVAELHQGHRQRRRDVRPRTRRSGVRAVERGALALLRDLSVAVVTDQIAQAAPAIYVNLVDYDDMAHHAGPTRPEATRTLDGLDRLVGFFADVVRETGRSYDIAVVSDHGQAQGATFAQLAGEPLEAVVATLTDPCPAAVDRASAQPDARAAEHASPLNLLLSATAHAEGMAARLLTRIRAAGPAGAAAAPAGGPVIAVGGNLAHIYLRELPGRLNREQLDAHSPRLVAGLVAHPQIGLVMVRTAASTATPGQVLALGATGWRVLTSCGAVGGAGTDPTVDFGPGAACDLWALDGRAHVGDVVILSRPDLATGEVAAFEDLVGSHGGLGGDQTRALLMHPAGWDVPGTALGGVDVHRLLLAARPGP